ncbi:MAG: hypothetical protein DMF78_03365 [Acidobacteria bacterium]|nr:MAG: hypothetical protein DMF78_03365 [Acidobacteriota bacterium]
MTRTETVVAATVVLAGLGLGVLAGAARFVRGHVRSDVTSADRAGAELDGEMARFAGQPPLREIRDGQEPLKARAPTIIGEPTRFLRARFSDVRSHRIVRVDLPLRLLRIAKRGGFRYLGELTPLQDDTEFEGDRIDLPLEEIVGHGPLLIVSHSHASGARIVAWVD